MDFLDKITAACADHNMFEGTLLSPHYPAARTAFPFCMH